MDSSASAALTRLSWAYFGVGEVGGWSYEYARPRKAESEPLLFAGAFMSQFLLCSTPPGRFKTIVNVLNCKETR